MLDDYCLEMPGLGFLLFIFPVLLGIVLAAFLFFARRARFLASYSVCIPLFGASGGWSGMKAGLHLSQGYMYGTSQSWLSAHAFVLAFIIGCSLGIWIGAIAAFGVNRLIHRAAI
jgi:hypothetical protein